MLPHSLLRNKAIIQMQKKEKLLNNNKQKTVREKHLIFKHVPRIRCTETKTDGKTDRQMGVGRLIDGLF